MHNLLSYKGDVYFNLYTLKKFIWASKKTFGLSKGNSRGMSRAISYNKLHMFKKAISACKEAIYMNPHNAEAYYILGNTYSNLSMYTKAVEAYKQAIGNKSKYTEALYRLSIAYSRLGRIKEAIDVTRRVIMIKPNMAAAHKNLGIFYGSQGSFNEAIYSLNRVLKLEHDNVEVRSMLIQYYLKLNDKESAKREYKVLQNLSPHMANILSHEIPK